MTMEDTMAEDTPRKGLGRGLSALMGDAGEDYAHGLVVIDADDRRHVLIPDQDSFGGDAESIG